ncbi:MAG: hypothetical protein HDR19_00135 [Lachnospiraceae bacterium]|nr:hypothetical protein [Lachnospiraceae bacterium]
MKKKCAFIVKGIFFLVLLTILLFFLDRMFVPKYFIDNRWSTTATYLGFYEMPKDSIDVLFLGSNYGVTAFIPQELYNNYGITSYNLSCEQQNLVISYYWLKEALRFQKPKAVVLETFYLFNDQFTSSEAYIRKAIDYMKWSNVKVQAIEDICSIDTNQTKNSYYFTNLRFHTRWAELSENDFSYSKMSSHYEMKGFSTTFDQANDNDYVPLYTEGNDETTKADELMQRYIEKISALCATNDIKLILVKTPAPSQKIGKYNTTKQLADTLNVKFYDFNTMQLYNDIEFSYDSDMMDTNGHTSFKGAIKITNYLGNLLQTDYDIAPQVNDAWENTRYAYSCLLCNANLKHIPDINTYLDCLNLMKDHYSILIAVKDDATSCLNDDVVRKFNDLGLSFRLMEKSGTSYIAVISPENIYEDIGNTPLEAKGTIRNGIVRYQITSAGSTCEHPSCSIQLDGTEYARAGSGLNIVVYDNLTKKVIDRVSFDTASPGLSSLR